MWSQRETPRRMVVARYRHTSSLPSILVLVLGFGCGDASQTDERADASSPDGSTRDSATPGIPDSATPDGAASARPDGALPDGAIVGRLDSAMPDGAASDSGTLPNPGVSCLSTARTTEEPDSSDFTYSFSVPDHALDASGTMWSAPPVERSLLRLEGEFLGCLSGGSAGAVVDYGYPDDAVYECEPTHCPSSGCPSPCFPYHSAKAVSPRNTGGMIIEDIAILNTGDGIAMRPESSDVVVRRVYMDGIHDDAVENDFGADGYLIEDSLFERVFIAFAMDLAGAAGTTDQRSAVWDIRRNLVRFHAFPNSWGQHFGHSGIFKLNDDMNEPQFRLVDNTFVLGPVMVNWARVAPPVSQTIECQNNTVLWLGSQADWDAARRRASHPDGGTNGERIDALNARFGDSCFNVIVRPSSTSESQFLAEQGWTAKVAAWKATHAAARAL